MSEIYKQALQQAEAQLANAVRERDRWTVEIARLEQLVKSLSAVAEKGSVPGSFARAFEEIGIQDVVLAFVGQSPLPVIAMDVRDRLKEIGYDLSRFKNPMAVIHGALKRLAVAGVIEDAGQGRFRRKVTSSGLPGKTK